MIDLKLLEKIIEELLTPEEYKDLQEELTQIGYDLQIIKRNRYEFMQTRRRESQAISKGL